jgi:hypothetical protein
VKERGIDLDQRKQITVQDDLDKTSLDVADLEDRIVRREHVPPEPGDSDQVLQQNIQYYNWNSEHLLAWQTNVRFIAVNCM